MAGQQVIDPLSHDGDLHDVSFFDGDNGDFSTPDYPELQQLAMSIIGNGDEFGFNGTLAIGDFIEQPPIALELSDLLTDDSGALVLSGDAPVEIHTAQNVVDQGVAMPHTMVGGEDVSGFAFMVFDHGPTIYYPSGLDVAVTIGELT
ncbi:MAG: hypothetical protein KDG54_12095 [Geminicoccaceae bacterium]|nr:hypothetical protein [Geminicoccaceae bacterium]